MQSAFFIVIYFVAINILGFALMGSDKRRAMRRAFRIPEATLFAVSIIGGSIGTTLGMFVFRHKTKHWYFRFGLPLILILQILLLFFFKLGPFEFSFM
ncbi:MAG: DUF1294 domain-containing protein [Butyrivibrio sp.]|nr:DUF1294 domain-containing protein [Butyrivibrio sp.]